MVLKKVGGKYVVQSERTHRNLSKPLSKKRAIRRLRQVEYFKSHPQRR